MCAYFFTEKDEEKYIFIDLRSVTYSTTFRILSLLQVM